MRGPSRGRPAASMPTRRPAAAPGGLLPLCLASVAWVACLGGCAGYQLGNATLYPANIRTVYVPVFQSASFRPNLGEQLTEAVVKEIEEKTPYKVVGTPNADSTLSGQIVGEGKRVLVFTRTGDPREVETEVRVEVTWVDNCGKVIGGGPVALPPEFVEVLGTGSLVPEVGQSVATSYQKSISRVAEQIVALMEAPW